MKCEHEAMNSSIIILSTCDMTHNNPSTRPDGNSMYYSITYRIAGNFRMVQIFAVFADRSAAAKIKTTKFSIASYGLLMGVVSPER